MEFESNPSKPVEKWGALHELPKNTTAATGWYI